MKSTTLRIVRIGNSRGVRLPAALLARYRIGEAVAVEPRRDGIVLRLLDDGRLSWDDTFRAMALEKRRRRVEFGDFDGVVADGLDGLEK
jgi:antitoxin MazE